MKKSIVYSFIVLLTLFSCNGKKDSNQKDENPNDYTNSQDLSKIRKNNLADTVYNESPAKIISAPRANSPNWLYLNCSNTLSFHLQDTFSVFNIEPSQGKASPIAKNIKSWIISPENSDQLTLKCIAGFDTGNYIWNETFNVIESPKPELAMIVNGKPYTGMTPIPKTSRIGIIIKPDAAFKKYFPEDANYGVESIDVFASLSLGPPTKVNTIRGGDASKPINLNLGTQVRQSRPGTTIYLKLNEVYRTNYLGQKIVDNRFTEQQKTFALVVR